MRCRLRARLADASTRLRGCARRIERNACLLLLVARDRRLAWTARAAAALGLGCVFSPIDLIPDTIPVIGYADDVAFLAAGLWVARLMVPSDIMASHGAFLDSLVRRGIGRAPMWAAVLRGPPTEANPASTAPSGHRPEHQYSIPFVIAVTLAGLIGFDLALDGIKHALPSIGWSIHTVRWAASALILGVGALEIALRAVGFEHPKVNALDPLLGWRPRPGVRSNYTREGSSFISFNSAGYRDSEHALGKPEGVFRIAVLGDSMAEAREVPLETVFWKRLEKLLPAETFGGRRLEVLNFAVSGYGTAQALLTLQRHALAYSPDLVLLAFCTGTDFTDNSKALGGHRDRPYFELTDGKLALVRTAGDAPEFAGRARDEEIELRFLDGLRVFQFRRELKVRFSTLKRFSKRKMRGRLTAVGVDPGIYRPPKDEAWAKAWAVTEALILEIDTVSRAHGAAFMLVTLTNPTQVSPHSAVRLRLCETLGVADLQYPDRRLAALAARHGMLHAALVDSFIAHVAETGENPHTFTVDQPTLHWNELGHELAARDIAAVLRDAAPRLR